MGKDSIRSLAIYKKRSQKLEKRWQELCGRHLPLASKDSIWRYHRALRDDEPTQGWKLHISATVLNACKVFERVAPFLEARFVQFKAPSSLGELMKINSGLYYGYSQVGKFITVYPGTSEEAVALARQLHKLTRRMAGPSVPFDLRFSPASNVYYRFGAFRYLEIEHQNGQRTLAIEDRDGKLIPDVRESEKARPDWISDPFETRRPRPAVRKTLSPLATTFRVFRALVQRGKGGVYQAVDLSADPPRLCLLKEGRKHGELGWDGRDGSWRVRNEEHVLSQLSASGVDVPRIYSSFEVDGNYYLATEYIEGVCLHHLLDGLRRRIPVPRALRYGIQLADIFSQIHSAGWVWRDCKPMNIIVTPEGELRPLDFEGACRVDRPDPLLWGTPGFIPPERRDLNIRRDEHDDLYALGSMLYLLLTGRVAEETDPLPIERRRRNVPAAVRHLVMRLLSRSLDERPSAESVARELNAAISVYGNPPRRRAARRHLNRRDTLQGGDGRGLEKPARGKPEATVTARAVLEG